MTERSDIPNPEGSALTPKEEINLWLRKLERDWETADDSDDFSEYWGKYEKFMYLFAIHISAASVIRGRRRGFMGLPFRSVLHLLDDQRKPDEEPLMGEDVEHGCIPTAKEWFQYHPGSTRAKIIGEQGMQAAFGYHLGLLMEMFSDFRKSRQV
jgi:hypothetical protein